MFSRRTNTSYWRFSLWFLLLQIAAFAGATILLIVEFGETDKRGADVVYGYVPAPHDQVNGADFYYIVPLADGQNPANPGPGQSGNPTTDYETFDVDGDGTPDFMLVPGYAPERFERTDNRAAYIASFATILAAIIGVVGLIVVAMINRRSAKQDRTIQRLEDRLDLLISTRLFDADQQRPTVAAQPAESRPVTTPIDRPQR